MPDEKAITVYLNEVISLAASGHAGEHAYRPALQRLMASYSDVEAINDPKRSEHGAPDFVFQKKSNRDIILGYAEAKNLPERLDQVEQSDQMRRYSGYQNLYLTNYLDFRFYLDGQRYKEISIGKYDSGSVTTDPESFGRLARELQAFLSQPPQPIKSGSRLADLMGAKARRIRDDVMEYLASTQGDGVQLEKLFRLMRRMLVHDLDHERFADMYAQTLVYGLFVARYNDETPETFTRHEAIDLVPKSNPLLRQFFSHIAGPDFEERLANAVDELCEVFRISSVRDIIHRHYESDGTRDPIIHFYEDFLEAYDPVIKKSMGAFYTPLPVVQYIVRGIHRALKNELEIKKGLADGSKITKNHRTYLLDPQTGIPTKKYRDQKVQYPRVQLLDPAVGTATFLNEAVRFIYSQFEKTKQVGMWPAHVEDSLIKRLSGFELMMAPYTIAHLKLSMTLAETGANPNLSRLGVYLTNTLEEGTPYEPDLFSLLGLAEAVTQESVEAGRIKNERPVMVVLGNPPWLSVSSNDTPFANGLSKRYKVEPGGQQKLDEQKTWLQDDYVKFISFAESMIARTGAGVVGMITNNGYLTNATFRGMRWHLATTFDSIYIVDLHGSTNKREKAPDGGRDENVFDIKLGACIIIAVKKESSTKKYADVFHSELWGSRRSKFERLEADDLEFTKLQLDEEYFYFSPRISESSLEHKSAYKAGVPIEKLFRIQSSALVTARDKLTIDIDGGDLIRKIEYFADPNTSEHELRTEWFGTPRTKKYPRGDTRGWKLADARVAIRKNDHQEYLRPITYRPFDDRWIYFCDDMIDWPRQKVMNHMLELPNVGLCFERGGVAEKNPFFVSENMVPNGISYSNTASIAYLAPLYLADSHLGRVDNLEPGSRAELVKNLNGDPTPQQIFDYVYAVLYSPQYKSKYHEFLAEGFPRVPAPTSDGKFEQFARLGERLRLFHLMKSPEVDEFVTSFPHAGDGFVRCVEFCSLRNEVRINSTQVFGGVPEDAWSLYIGGHQPAQKWLKDRLDRTLSLNDLMHYQRIIRVLVETVRVQDELAELGSVW